MIRRPGTSNNCEHKSVWDEAPAGSKVLAFREVSIGGMDDVDREDNGGMQTEKSFDIKLSIAVTSPPGEKVEDDRH